MEWQRVGHDLATRQLQIKINNPVCRPVVYKDGQVLLLSLLLAV